LQSLTLPRRLNKPTTDLLPEIVCTSHNNAMDKEKRPVFSLPPSLLQAAETKGSIFYFWKEQLDALNRNHKQFLAQFPDERSEDLSTTVVSDVSFAHHHPGFQDLASSSTTAVGSTVRHGQGAPTETKLGVAASSLSGTLSEAPVKKPTSSSKEHQLEQVKISEQAFATQYGVGWGTMLGRLIAYQQKKGHCNVTAAYAKEDLALVKWVKLQRDRKRADQMSPQEIRTFESLGFKWTASCKNSREVENSWTDMLGRLKVYKRKHGDCLVPQVCMIVRDAKSACLSYPLLCANVSRHFILPQRHKEDIALGMNDRKRLEECQEFCLSYYPSLCANVSRRLIHFSFSRNKTGTWCKNQRWKIKHNRITSDQKAKLDAIGFPWTIAEKDRRRRGKAKPPIHKQPQRRNPPTIAPKPANDNDQNSQAMVNTMLNTNGLLWK